MRSHPTSPLSQAALRSSALLSPASQPSSSQSSSPRVSSSGLPSRSARRIRRSLAGTVGVAAVVVGTLLAPQSVAAGRSSSTTIAEQADKALASLHEWQRTGSADDELTYELLRDRLATTIAGAVGVDAAELRAEWDAADVVNQEIVLKATTQVGVPYRYLASEEGVGFDCSGLLLYAYGSVGIDLPRVSYDQIKAGPKVAQADVEPADLAQYPGHIMMVLGSKVMLHARSTGYNVEVAPMPTRKLQFADVTDEDALASGDGVASTTKTVAVVGSTATTSDTAAASSTSVPIWNATVAGAVAALAGSRRG